MAYNALDDILGELAEETVLQLVDDSSAGIDVDMVKLALAGDDLADLDPDQATAAVKAAAAVSSALNRASAQVDGYCSTLHQVPFDPPSPFIRALDLDIVIYNLYSRRENVPENRSDRNKNAIKALEAIAAGKILIGAPKTAPQPTDRDVLFTGGTSAMEERLKNY